MYTGGWNEIKSFENGMGRKSKDGKKGSKPKKSFLLWIVQKEKIGYFNLTTLFCTIFTKMFHIKAKWGVKPMIFRCREKKTPKVREDGGEDNQ